ncbi:MAG: ROK family protein [Gammaproteobacteria bacterium]|nr:ROK family protein [Gammaproteobacteria bacterium]
MRFGIDLGGTKIELIALDDSGLEVFRERMTTPQGDYAATLEVMVQLVQQAEATLGVSGTLGIGTPGAVSKLTGSIKNSNSICLNGRPLREDLENRLKRPVRMANDADCFALSEAVDGAGKGYGTVFGVILGTGVGGGIVVGGRLLQGPNAIAGEWGHNPLPWMNLEEYPGPPCYCGKKGCIETFLSGPGLALDHLAKTGIELKAPAILESASKGDPNAEATFLRYEDRLARALAHVINLIDPDAIVLGGGLSNCDRLYTAIPALWGRYIFSDQVITPLYPPVHGDSGGVRGAAWLWGS